MNWKTENSECIVSQEYLLVLSFLYFLGLSLRKEQVFTKRRLVCLGLSPSEGLLWNRERHHRAKTCLNLL